MNVTGEFKQLESLRRLKSFDKLRIAFELYDFARSRITSEIRRINPGITEQELLKKVNERFVLIK